MSAKLIPIDMSEVELDKRFPLPARVEIPCPVCGKTLVSRPDQYLSYPMPGQVSHVYMCCDECDDGEVDIPVVLEVSVRLATEEEARADAEG